MKRFVWKDGIWAAQDLADEAGWWRTSDRVVLEGRRLYFEGRADRVVKVLGELVNLEAVERALENAGLSRARFAVMALPEERRGSDLVLLVEDGPGRMERAVKKYHATAPPFARISQVVPVKELPRSPLGKIRYAALAALISPAVRG